MHCEHHKIINNKDEKGEEVCYKTFNHTQDNEHSAFVCRHEIHIRSRVAQTLGDIAKVRVLLIGQILESKTVRGFVIIRFGLLENH